MRKRNTEGRPYVLLMQQFGLLSPRYVGDAFHLWMQLCEDRVVRERSQKFAARKRADYLPSVMAGYSYASRVLQQMTPRELAALKVRLGVRPEKEFAAL
jgi:hypothetical protein